MIHNNNKRSLVLPLLALLIVGIVLLPMAASIMIKKVLTEQPDLILDIIDENSDKVLELVLAAQKKKQIAQQETSEVQKRLAELRNPKRPQGLDSRPAKPGSAPDASITIVTYSSFQCPKCAEGSDIINDLMVKYPNKLSIYYKHLTGDTVAFQLGMIFEAAALQDPAKAWQLHDYMFANMELVRGGTAQIVFPYAKQIGLDLQKLSLDMYSQKIRDIMTKDLHEGKEFGLSLTPTILINGISITGAKPMDEFTDLIDQILKKEQSNG